MLSNTSVLSLLDLSGIMSQTKSVSRVTAVEKRGEGIGMEFTLHAFTVAFNRSYISPMSQNAAQSANLCL